jgi:RimJ/RimL family protein N-acetyltransferase
MITAFRERQTLTGTKVRLEPLGPAHFDGEWAILGDEEAKRLTGSHQTFTETRVRSWLAAVSAAADRADWAIIRRSDDAFVGEVVLNDLDEDNRAMNFRIIVGGDPDFRGHGFGTEATRLAVAYAFEAGVHRVSLEVFDFNPRARHVYEKCGFVTEGVARDALWWEGEWHDAVQMSMLSTDPRP